MKKIILFILLFSCSTVFTFAQSAKTELYDLIKKLLYDSTGYDNVGEWAVGQPKRFPVKWKADKIEISEDTSINFYRLGTADIAIKSHAFVKAGQAVKWNIMLKGARSGYSSFSILCSPAEDLLPGYTIDSIFGKKPFVAKLLRSCDAKTLSGYYYYELKLPKKDIAYLKVSWLSLNGSTAMRLDCFDSWSKYAVKLDCPK